MGVRGSVPVVREDNLVEEVLEGGVGVLGTSVAANTRVDVLAAREDASLEADTSGVTLVVVLLPDVLGEVLADKRFAVLGELRPALKILGLLSSALQTVRSEGLVSATPLEELQPMVLVRLDNYLLSLL